MAWHSLRIPIFFKKDFITQPATFRIVAPAKFAGAEFAGCAWKLTTFRIVAPAKFVVAEFAGCAWKLEQFRIVAPSLM